MGLDPAQLKIDPQWLPFYRSGLRYLLRPERARAPCSSEPSDAPAEHRKGMLGRLERLSPPYSVLMTYWELCLDLSGACPDEKCSQRRQLFSRMISGLGWTDAEYVFWPLSHCPGSEPVADAELFWQGLRSLRPRFVLLFGERATDTVLPRQDPRTSRVEMDGVTYLSLPGPEEMLPDNRQAKNRVWRELRSLPLPPRPDETDT